MKKKVAIINQRYGLEVNGGSEYYTRLLAEHLNDEFDIEVLTTTALDYDTWADYYPVGETMVGGVKVKRFPVAHKRNRIRFAMLCRILRWLPRHPLWLEYLWVREQGPYVPELLRYLKKDLYDVCVFVTYLYYPTVFGVPEMARRAIVIPTAHDEPFIHYRCYQPVFTEPRALIYLTDEEKMFVENLFGQRLPEGRVLGMGLQMPTDADENRFRKKYDIIGDYVIYVGRIDYGKNCDQMIQYFLNYKATTQSALKLVLLGKSMIDIPGNDDILFLGFVSDQDKFDAIQGARALILPSEFESLSISVLEAMGQGTPVLVNGACSVLKGHVEKSHGGCSFESERSFCEGLDRLTEVDEQYQSMCENAKSYVEKYYSWNSVLIQYTRAIREVAGV